MLYLMLDDKGDRYLAKVGYSDRSNISNRRQTYYSHNPLAIMRSKCAGGRDEEITARQKLEKAALARIKGTEWFVITEQLYDELYDKGMQYFYPNTMSKKVYFPED